jgi:predicted MFS family arabinose efflux permease
MFRPRKQSSAKLRKLLQIDAFQEPPYLVFVIGFFLTWLGYFVPSFFIPTYARVSLGASDSLKFYLVSIMNAGSFFGRIVPSILAHYTSPISVLTISGISAGILFFSWFGIHNIPGFIVFTALWGFLNGVIVTLPGAVVASLSPTPEEVGTRIGMAWGVGALGILISSPIGGALTDLSTKNFTGMIAWSGTVMLSGSLLFIYPWVVARRATRRSKIGAA